MNSYGLFRVMTKDRPEIVIEGSDDGIEWRPYVFKWKPGPLDRMPAFVEPHQPRLDWQMWFAALGDAQEEPMVLRADAAIARKFARCHAFVRQQSFPGQTAALSARGTLSLSLQYSGGTPGITGFGGRVRICAVSADGFAASGITSAPGVCLSNRR